MDKLAAPTDFFRKFNIKESDFKNTGLEWEELERIYEDHINNIPFLESQILILFSKFVKITNVHSVKYRVKDPEHLIEKIIRKKIKDPQRDITFDTYINQIDDILGLRVLHLFKDEWRSVHEHIIGKGYTLKEPPKAYYREGDSKETLNEYILCDCVPEQHKYGYRSIHYIIQQKILSNTIACEVQVRTVFEEAWSEIDHTIRYPYDMDNPIFKQYLMIVNRLAGSADEMGTFVVNLKEHLAKQAYEYQEEIDKKNTVINELKKELSELKLSKEVQESINSKIRKLTKTSSMNAFPKGFIPFCQHIGIADTNKSFAIQKNIWDAMHSTTLASAALPWENNIKNATSAYIRATDAAKTWEMQFKTINAGLTKVPPISNYNFPADLLSIDSVVKPATTPNNSFPYSFSAIDKKDSDKENNTNKESID